MNLIEIYFWFKEDGAIVIEEWKAMNCDDDIKIKHFNDYDLRLYFACCKTFQTLNNYVCLTDVKRDLDYCKIVLTQIDGMFKTYINDKYFLDFRNPTVIKVIEGLEYHRIKNIIEDYLKYSIRHKLFEISESSL